jgi:hypothetical protein
LRQDAKLNAAKAIEAERLATLLEIADFDASENIVAADAALAAWRELTGA